MSKSFHHRSLNTIDKMMHSNICFDRDAGYNASRDSSAQRKNRMKRMEELSHSLDDGLNNMPDEYVTSSSSKRHSSSTTAMRRNAIQPYDEEEDDYDDYGDDEFMEDCYYNNTKSSFDGRPRSYNEKYSNSYDYDYDNGANFGRNRYSLNESAPQQKSGGRYQQSPVAQQKYSSLRRPQPSPMSGKHILFNDEDDVHYMNDRSKNSKKSSSSSNNSLKKESSSATQRKEKEATVRKKSQEDAAAAASSAAKSEKSEKSSSLQVMKAKLKIHSMSNDDSVINVRSSPMTKPISFLRHHSVEAKLPSHHSDRSNMSPTIMEEIEFEMQDVETEGEKDLEEEAKRNEAEEQQQQQQVAKENKKGAKEKKDKKGNSVPSTPTTKKSLKAHLNKKLFKVPDIDLNSLKFPCFFSSHKNIAALKGKKDDNTSKSAEALNAEPSSSSKSSPKSSPTTKSPPVLKTPPSSPKKPLKSNDIVAAKSEKACEKIEHEKSTKTNSNDSMSSPNRPNVEYFTDNENFSDGEFEV
jgi:hypothetical protein